MIPYWQQAKTHLSKKDAVLKKIIASYEGEFLAPKGDAFLTLARAIVGQQISVKAADSVWGRLTCHPALVAGSGRPDPALRRDDVDRLTDADLRACGLSAQKVTYLRALADYFKTPRGFSAMEDAEVIRELTSVKGTGVWTAEMFLIFHLARPDIFPIKDIGLQKAMFQHYFDGQKTALETVEKRAEPWRPYRSVATWYLWRALDPVPVAY